MKIISTTNPNSLVTPSEQRGQDMALGLFAEAARRIPAYKNFLASEHIKPNQIKTIADFAHVPLIDKQNYLTQYSMRELSWDGNLFNSRIISVSSGSSGNPLFWPRGLEQDLEGAFMHERLYRHVFNMDKLNTLVVVCFSMGTWIAGSFTAASTLELAGQGYKLNLVTPGIEKDEALRVIKQLAPLYDQVVLVGYPPFTKDLIDQGEEFGIKWKKLRVRLLWAGESFGEEWRDYILRKIGSKDPYHDTINIYGSADAAMLGHETPVSIALRRIFNRRPRVRQNLFGPGPLPSLVQYYPDRRYFESVDNELIFTARAGIALVRYNIHDTGGVLSYGDMTAAAGEPFEAIVRSHPLNTKAWELPFLYLKGRKDFTVTIYAVNIYPENIRAALVDPKMRSWVTGKFTMATKYHGDMDQYFEINIEMAKGLDPENDYLQIAKRTIVTKLNRLNAEFHKLSAAIGLKAEPHIHLIKYGDEKYFANNVKHRWVKKVDGKN